VACGAQPTVVEVPKRPMPRSPLGVQAIVATAPMAPYVPSPKAAPPAGTDGAPPGMARNEVADAQRPPSQGRRSQGGAPGAPATFRGNTPPSAGGGPRMARRSAG
jgi:hypothetical protein